MYHFKQEKEVETLFLAVQYTFQLPAVTNNPFKKKKKRNQCVWECAKCKEGRESLLREEWEGGEPLLQPPWLGDVLLVAGAAVRIPAVPVTRLVCSLQACRRGRRRCGESTRSSTSSPAPIWAPWSASSSTSSGTRDQWGGCNSSLPVAEAKELPSSLASPVILVFFYFFFRIALQEETNRMSANALAIVFAPCILRCPDTTDPLQSVQDISKTTT